MKSIKNVNVSSARLLAVNILLDICLRGKFANLALKQKIRDSSLSKKDVILTTRLVYGTLEKQLTIDWILKHYINTEKTNLIIMTILRLGCYQILYLDKIPISAACNESVMLCKALGFQGLSAFVNAVLRNVARDKSSAKFLFGGSDILSMSLRYSYPEWLIKDLINNYGEETAKMIIDDTVTLETVTIRANTMKTNVSNLVEELKKSSIIALPGNYTSEALRIPLTEDIEQNILYNCGLFTIQDEASMLVVQILDPKPGEMILDACAAPGGKTTFIAEKMTNTGIIHAWDIHEKRVKLINKNAQRMGSSIIVASMQDAREKFPRFEGCFDRVLVDAPCSGLGVTHKKPEIKLRLTEQYLDELTEVQWKILINCSNFVKPGGVLVYSTCTINADENNKMIYKFIENYDNFKIDCVKDYLPENMQDKVSSDGTIQLIPSRDLIDGFFICRLKRMW